MSQIEITEEDRQMILLALAELSLRRPGWLDALGRVADRFRGRDMFESFRETSADLFEARDEGGRGREAALADRAGE